MISTLTELTTHFSVTNEMSLNYTSIILDELNAVSHSYNKGGLKPMFAIVKNSNSLLDENFNMEKDGSLDYALAA